MFWLYGLRPLAKLQNQQDGWQSVNLFHVEKTMFHSPLGEDRLDTPRCYRSGRQIATVAHRPEPLLPTHRALSESKLRSSQTQRCVLFSFDLMFSLGAVHFYSCLRRSRSERTKPVVADWQTTSLVHRTSRGCIFDTVHGHDLSSQDNN